MMIHLRGQTRQNLKQKETLKFRQPEKFLSNAVSVPISARYTYQWIGFLADLFYWGSWLHHYTQSSTF